jgi:hypothetical protein
MSGGLCDLVNSPVERLGVMPGGGAETADFPDILQGRGPHVIVGDLLGVRRAEGLNGTAHSPRLVEPEEGL